MPRMRLVIAALLLTLSGLALAEPSAAAPASVPGTTSATSVAPPHNSIPFKQDKQSTDTLAYQSVAALVLVGLAAYGIVFGLKRYGGKLSDKLGRMRRVHIVEAVRLGRRSMLYVVEYHGQELLLAESEHGVQLVTKHQLSAPNNAEGASNA